MVSFRIGITQILNEGNPEIIFRDITDSLLPMTLLYENLTYALRGMFFKIYNELGPGFREDVYVKALLTLLDKEHIFYEKEKHYVVHFQDAHVGSTRLDLVVDKKIIVEIKATEIHSTLFEKQMLSYLKSTNLSLGFLVNFGTKKLFIKRFIHTQVSAKSKRTDTNGDFIKESVISSLQI